MTREPSCLEIREVLTIAQSDAHRLKPRELLRQPDDFFNGIRSLNLTVQESQDADGQCLALLCPLELVFQRIQLIFVHERPLSRRSCRPPHLPMATGDHLGERASSSWSPAPNASFLQHIMIVSLSIVGDVLSIERRINRGFGWNGFGKQPGS